MFIYTINDIIGAAFFGMFLLLGLFVLVLIVVDKMKRKFRNKK
jgi:uncharacterized membrane protein YqjE